jgi:hypothetical protein
MAKAIAFAVDLKDLSLLEETVEDGGGGRHVAKQLAPVLNGTIGGHESGAILVSTNDNLQEAFSAFGREVLHAKIVDAKQIGFEKAI